MRLISLSVVSCIMAHDILLDAEQEQKLRDQKISVNIIPDYYYKELEG